ncbi:site-specific integrase [Amphibacillus sp. MSJ-3]|uniref:tyrosine-type recombinase/integrase n=1 Tax=Amphibacillus sp. MSJ-3 TaxID=2841505 RepID=UPI001C0E9F2D|nr:site-specific integrase [Amphibacillus sp. MSJ-3]MBU5594875.1 site-specific integrase [Amphibacillus sp. MSJ-3]
MKLNKTKIDDEIYYYFLKSGEKRWMYRHKYYDTLGKRREKKKSGFKSEKQALKALLKLKADLLDGNVKKVEHDQMTVSQWFDIWFDAYKSNWGVKTVARRKEIVENQIKPLIGKRKIAKLDRSTYIREFINPLLEKYSPGSVYMYHRIFSIGINAAVNDERIPRNRFKNIKIKKDEKLKNFLTPDELNILLVTADKFSPNRSIFIWILAYTGMRKGESLGLKWDDIDFNKKTISIKRTRDEYGVRLPKTRNSYRVIKVDDILLNRLRSYRTWCKEIKLKNGKKLHENDYVIISIQSGEPIGDRFTYKFFNLMYDDLKKQGINLKRITPHGLRHTHATILINNGVPAKTVADKLGNTVEMVYKVYVHSFDEMEEKALDIFNNALGGAKSGAK